MHIHIQHALHWPGARVLRSLPPAVPTSTVMVYSVVGSRSSITTLESLVLTVLIAHATRPTCEDGWYVTKYTGNPLAWWRVSGVQLTRAALLSVFILSTFALFTWAVGAVWLKEIKQQRNKEQLQHSIHSTTRNDCTILKCIAPHETKVKRTP